MASEVIPFPSVIAGRTHQSLSYALLLAILLGAVVGVMSMPAPGLTWDARQYVDTAEHLVAGQGFVTTAHDALSDHATARPGYYPPGLPLLLTPFAAVGEVRTGSQLLSLLYLAAVVWAAWSLGGRGAATLAAAMVAVSPFLYQSSATVMSDATAATLALAALALLSRPRRGRLVLAGAAVGFAVVVRLSSAPVALAAVLAAPRHERRWIVLGAAPFALGLMAFQAHYFGSPIETSYGDAVGWSLSSALSSSHGDVALQLGTPAAPFSAPYAQLPGWLYWPSGLGWWWAFGPPVVGLLGLVPAWRLRRTPAGAFALWTCAGMLLLTVPYTYQATRMLAAPATVLLVFSAVAAARLLSASLARRDPGLPLGPTVDSSDERPGEQPGQGAPVAQRTGPTP